MKLKMFLATAKNIERVILLDGWKDSNNQLYDGKYGDLASTIIDKGWNDADVLKWEVDGTTLTVEICIY